LVFIDRIVNNPWRGCELKYRAALPFEGSTMARLVRHDKNTPYQIAAGTELPVYICACGLSRNKPFCDGSHKKTRDENQAETYVYDDAGRVRVGKEY